jgi:hypothetical protein
LQAGFKLVARHGNLNLLKRSFKKFGCRHQTLLRAFLANVVPARFNVGRTALVKRLNVQVDQVDPRGRVHRNSIDFLDRHLIQYFAPQLHNLFNELGSHVFEGHVLKRLQLIFVQQGSNHSAAVTLCKVFQQGLADKILWI